MKSSDTLLKTKKCNVPNINDDIDAPTDNSINPFNNDILEHLTFREKIQVNYL